MRAIVVAMMLSTIVLLGLAILLAYTNRFPKRELALVWQKVSTGKSELKDDNAVEEEQPPVEEPSFDQVIRKRAAEAREIERRKQEVQNLIELAQARQRELETRRQAVTKLQQELAKGFEEKLDEVVKQGRANLLEKIEVMAPKLANEFLLDQAEEDEKVTLEIIKKLDPVIASKIFKEFKQPEEVDRLNQLLAKIGQGEPEKSAVEQLRASAAVPANR